jgi:hypothetical protein
MISVARTVLKAARPGRRLFRPPNLPSGGVWIHSATWQKGERLDIIHSEQANRAGGKKNPVIPLQYLVPASICPEPGE